MEQAEGYAELIESGQPGKFLLQFFLLHLFLSVTRDS